MKISTTVVSFLLTLLLITGKYVMAKLTMTQSSSEVIVGGTTRMSCVTALPKEIYWFHFLPGSPIQREVYAYGKMHSPYKERFEIHKNVTTGFYELVIPRVNITDAGLYICHENEGNGDSDLGQLTVLESGPTCTSDKNPLELIGPNSCNKQQENLTLACSVAYRGNIDPQLEWKMVGSNNAVTQGINVEKTENRITSRLAIHSKPAFDGSSFICRTTLSRDNCTSDVINVIYAISSDFTQDAEIGDTIVCTANTNESSSYKWKWFKGDDTLTVSNNQILIPKQPGNFKCEVDYFIRKEPCTVIAMFASVEGGNATYTTEEPAVGSRYIGVIVIVIVMIFAIIFSVPAVFYFLRKKKKQREEMQKESNELLMPKYKGIIKDREEIPKYYGQMPFIEKSSSGEINGPFIFQDIKCMCEKILHTPTDVSSAAEKEVFSRGKRWMELNDKNVLKFYDMIIKPPALFIVMDYAEGGNVRKVLDSCTENLEISVVKDWTMQIADGMNYLHSKNIIHKRLKAAQIFILEPFETTDPSPKTLKIASCKLTRGQGHSADLSSKEGFGWLSPEAISEEPNDKACDVWSYGVTIWEILTKDIPHKGVKLTVLLKDLSEGNRPLDIPNRCPDVIRKVLQDCWMKDKEKRATFPEIVSRLRAVADC